MGSQVQLCGAVRKLMCLCVIDLVYCTTLPAKVQGTADQIACMGTKSSFVVWPTADSRSSQVLLYGVVDT